MDSMRGFLTPRIIIALVFAGLIIVVAVFGRDRNPSKEGGLISGTVTSQKTLNEVIGQDSDKDGLQDWEEALWGTNPNLPDSDNDGVSDFEEVGEARTAIKENNPSSNAVTQINTTDALARQLFATVASLDQSGSVNESTLGSVADTFTKAIKEESLEPSYTYSDITLSSLGKDSLKNYASALLGALKPFGDKKLGAELKIISEAVSRNDPKKLEQIKPFVSLYRELGKALAGVPVPPEIAQTHLNLMNSSGAIGKSLENILVIFSDPVVGLFGISSYQGASTAMVGYLSAIQTYLSSSGIVLNNQ